MSSVKMQEFITDLALKGQTKESLILQLMYSCCFSVREISFLTYENISSKDVLTFWNESSHEFKHIFLHRGLALDIQFYKQLNKIA